MYTTMLRTIARVPPKICQAMLSANLQIIVTHMFYVIENINSGPAQLFDLKSNLAILIVYGSF